MNNYTRFEDEIGHLRALCMEDLLKEALHILLAAYNLPAHSSTYFHPLQTCTAKYALSEVKQSQACTIRRGSHSSSGRLSLSENLEGQKKRNASSKCKTAQRERGLQSIQCFDTRSAIWDSIIQV
ncbi:hypothetical protein SUGI_0124200 [Cryptomeria japonica]|nr:hypothetical protein SUGI_0124200 [Cryptomeria japonica]